MATSPGISTTEDHFAIGFLTVSYLLGQRDEPLAGLLRDVASGQTAGRVAPFLEGLVHPAREQRSLTLKSGAALVLSALRRRSQERRR